MKFKSVIIIVFVFTTIYRLFAIDFIPIFGINSLENVKYYLETINVDDVDDRGYPPLFYAAAFNTIDVVKYLIEEKQANYMYPINYIYPFDFALGISGYSEVVEYFININAPYSREVSFPTPLFRSVATGSNYSVFKSLLRRYSDINETNNEGQTPLMIAAQYNSKSDAIEFLLANGADTTIVDYHNKSAYDYALENEKLKSNMILEKLEISKTSSTSNGSEQYPELREFAKRKYPYDQSMQDYIYNEQVEAYLYMKNVNDYELKSIAERKYPTDYSMQKYIYDEQLESKYYMQKVTDYEVKQIATRKYPSDYSMQKYIYDEQFIAKQYMSTRNNYSAKSEAQRKYPSDYSMQKYIYDQLSTY